jgi:hypothetical protein
MVCLQFTQRPNADRSIPGLPLMPDGQDRDRIAFDAIPGHIAIISEINRPLPVLFRQVIHESPHPRVRTESLHTLPDRFRGSLRSARSLRPKEITQRMSGSTPASPPTKIPIVEFNRVQTSEARSSACRNDQGAHHDSSIARSGPAVPRHRPRLANADGRGAQRLAKTAYAVPNVNTPCAAA